MLVRLKDVLTVSVNNYKSADNWSEFKYLDTGNLTNNFIDQIATFTQESDLPSRAKQKVEIGDILYSSVRPNQCHFGYVEEQIDNLLVSTGFIILKPKKDIVHGKFIYYFLAQPRITTLLQNVAQLSTSSYPSITSDDILALNIDLPSLQNQEKIVSILYSIDKQIDRNFGMVEKLQVLALASFDHFSREKSDANTVVLKDIIIERDKSTIQVNNVDADSGCIPFFTSGDAILYTDNSLVSGFNIFLSTGGNAKVQSYFGDASYSTDTWCISANNGLQYYLFGYLKHIEGQMDRLYFHGTGLKHLQKPIFLKSTLRVPPETLLQEYNSIVAPLYEQISSIKRSIVDLQRIKAKLLPLLINQQLQ